MGLDTNAADFSAPGSLAVLLEAYDLASLTSVFFLPEKCCGWVMFNVFCSFVKR